MSQQTTPPLPEGFLAGHATGRTTGVTVVLCPEGATAGVDVRGGATGSRELDPCRPGHLVRRVHGVCLAGGSAYGLAAAGGVMRWLEERGSGFRTSAARVPIVPAAILYDLGLGDASERPDEAMGYAACEGAHAVLPPPGSLGAGTGATVGKLRGVDGAMKGGVGTALFRDGELSVATVVAVNALGDVVDPTTGTILAGARGPDGRFLDAAGSLRAGGLLPDLDRPAPDPSTTLAVVLTNARLDTAGACRLASAGSLGAARSIRPVHTDYDGDLTFALASGRVDATPERLGALAADLVADAIVEAVQRARGVDGIPALAELGP
jgi:L-aminopeptidase/D-esterase-like protein